MPSPPIRLLFGAGLTLPVDGAFGLDAAKAFPLLRAGSEEAQSDAGAEDAWVTGFDEYLTGLARWIPLATGLSPYNTRHSGWEGADGWRALLRWAWAKNAIRVFPDARNVVRRPKMDVDTDGNAAADEFTFGQSGPISGATVQIEDSAQKLAFTGSTGSGWVEVTQTIDGIVPGERFALSAECRFGGLAGGANGYLAVKYRDASNVTLAEHGIANLTQAAYARSGVVIPVAPANTAKTQLICRLIAPGAGSTGSAWFRKAQLERGAAAVSSAFIDNPQHDCYLVAPRDEEYEHEDDFTKRLALRLRTADGSAVTGI